MIITSSEIGFDISISDLSDMMPVDSAVNQRAIALITTVLLLFSTTLPANDDISWSYGIGVGALSLDDYRGSARRNDYLLPFPYLRLKSKRLAIDENGLHGRLAVIPNARLEMSMAAGIPVAADKNQLRQDMPGLAPSFEIGPALEMTISTSTDGNRELVINLPFRAAFTVSGFTIRHQGWILSPFIEYRLHFGRPEPWRLGIAAGPIYADRRYHDYYYGVEPEYSTLTRPTYSATAGYSGYRVTVTLAKRQGQYWYGMFARYDNLAGATFTDSPLVETDDYLAAGMAVACILGGSGMRNY